MNESKYFHNSDDSLSGCRFCKHRKRINNKNCCTVLGSPNATQVRLFDMCELYEKKID